MQLQMSELLALEVESSGFERIWMMQRGGDFGSDLWWICCADMSSVLMAEGKLWFSLCAME